MSEIVKNSVSQMQNADGCMRRWWGKSVQHWPQPQAAGTVYGDILHAVCDRYANATDQGLDSATGMPMDLYPHDWHRMKKRWDKSNTVYEINIVEQAQIRLLIQTAIESGILLREPGRIAEMEFHTQVIVPGFEGHAVDVNGFKDLVLPDGVFDHKTSKSTRYCLTIKKLKEDIQMMFYGLDHVLRHPNLTEVKLGHNQFIKDRQNPRVQQRIAKVTPGYVFDFFQQRILPLMYDMLLYRLKYPKGTDNYFKEVPGAKDTKECNFYYGKKCPYLNICTEITTPDKYCKIFEIKENRNNKPQLGEQTMSTKLMAAIVAEQGGVVPPSPAPVQPGPAAPIQPAQAPVGVGAPSQVGLTTTTTASGQVIPAFAPAPGQPIPGPVQPPVPVQIQAPIQAQAPVQIPVQIPAPIQAPPVAPPVTAQAPNLAPAMPQVPQAPAPSTETLTALNQAPWYFLDCEVCKVTGLQGFRADGQPCQICQLKTGSQAQPAAANPDGSVTYAQPNQEFQSPPLPAAVVQMQEQPTATPIPQAQQPTSVAFPPPQMPMVANQCPQMPPMMPQDTGTHYTLIMGCVVASDRTGNVAFDAQDLYRQALDLAQQQSGQDLRALDHFKALEIIDTLVPIAIREMSMAVISAHSGCKGSLYHRFVEGLRMYADRVIVACAE